MFDTTSSISPPIQDPPEDSSGSTDPDMPKPIDSRESVADKLTNFADYLEKYPNRIPAGSLKALSVLGIMVLGSIAGVVLLKQNLDTRKQASEGSTITKLCDTRDPAKLSPKVIENSKACLYNGKTYFACNDGYEFIDQKCATIPSK